MLVTTKEFVSLIKLQSRSFKGTDGKDVEYKQYVIMDEEGEMTEGTCKKTIDFDLVDGETLRGMATFFVQPEEKRGLYKMKLVSFDVA